MWIVVLDYDNSREENYDAGKRRFHIVQLQQQRKQSIAIVTVIARSLALLPGVGGARVLEESSRCVVPKPASMGDSPHVQGSVDLGYSTCEASFRLLGRYVSFADGLRCGFGARAQLRELQR